MAGEPYTINPNVLTEPFPAMGITAKGTNFLVANQNNNLVGLKVVVGTAKVPAGSTVYVREQCKTLDWAEAKQTVSYKGQKVIFVPEVAIAIVEPPQS
jgi:hypothetical protein